MDKIKTKDKEKSILTQTINLEELIPKEKILRLNVWDDFYGKVFLDGNVEVVTDMINAALVQEGIRIVEMRTQEHKSDLKAKAVIFDGIAIDDQGRRYAIEIQNVHEKGFEQRLAYEGSYLIQMTLEKGQKHEERLESTLIAFCRFKPRGVYLETGERFPDNEKIVMVDGSQIPDLYTPIGKVIHDMYEESAENMLLDSFKKSTHELKETKEGAKKMGEIQQLIYNQGEANGFIRGKAEGKEEGLAESISVLIQHGFPIEDIKKMYSSKYSEEDLQKALSHAELIVA